jgi:hypothetical protein
MVISHFGMKPCLFAVVLLAAPAFASGCASAPISMAPSNESRLVADQLVLRANADALATRLETAGWTITATPAEATRSFFGRLIGGSDSVEDADERPDAVVAYLGSADFQTVENDLEALVAETRALADQTLLVASSDGVIEASALTRDIASVERALGAVRRAEDFFESVIDRESWDNAAEAALLARLQGAGAAEARLASAADALAERRWATRSGLFG